MNLTSIKEKRIEQYLIKRVKELKGEIRKVKWIGRKDAPDRIIFLNGCHLVELKRPGETPRSSQVREFQKINSHGVRVTVLSTFEEVDDFISTIRTSEGDERVR